jgi:hypothetical protein
LRGLILLYAIKSVPAEGILIGLLGAAWDIEHAIFVDEVKHRVVNDKQAIGRDARHHPLQSLAILERSVADVLTPLPMVSVSSLSQQSMA